MMVKREPWWIHVVLMIVIIVLGYILLRVAIINKPTENKKEAVETEIDSSGNEKGYILY
jgi:uncharacterized protein YpmB